MILQLALFCSLFAGYTAAGKDVVCYVPTWTPTLLSKIDNSLCTVFVIAFGTVDSNGNVGLPDNFASFKSLRTANSKLVLALGGATAGTWVFKTISASAATRQTFAQNCLNVVKNNGLDGIDIDWEFPDSSDRAIFVALHQDLKNKLGSSYQVSTAVSGGQWLIKTNNVYDIAGLSAAVDRIHLMSYDMHMDEGWDSSFGAYFNAPVTASSGDSVEQAINLWLQGGAAASKLAVGVPFYGRQYQLSSSASTKPGSPFNSGHQASDASYTPAYYQYCSQLSDSTWTKAFDSAAQCPYMYKGSQWLSYEDSNSIVIKGNLANKYNLGGVMTWALHQDDFDGVCSSCKWTLLKALNSAVGRGSACSGGSNPATSGTSSTTATTKAGGQTTTSTTAPKTTTTTTAPTSGGTATCTYAGQFLSNPSDCTKYNQCIAAGQAPALMSCPSGLFWNKNGYCDWSCNA